MEGESGEDQYRTAVQTNKSKEHKQNKKKVRSEKLHGKSPKTPEVQQQTGKNKWNTQTKRKQVNRIKVSKKTEG